MSNEESLLMELRRENKRLRSAVECLINEMETDERYPDPSEAKKQLDDRNGASPPWEREGYESKQAWLDGKQE